MVELSTQKQSIINSVANKLQILNPVWLTNLINFETGGTFNPQIANPRSSAKGLIQFLDSTAQSLGYESSYDLVNKHPGFYSQMHGPVHQYLSNYAPFKAEYQLYMAVFYPAARKYTPDTPFRKIFKDRIQNASQAERSYKAFANANPGIVSPQDYVNMVRRKAGHKILSGSASGIASIIVITGAIAWLLTRKR